MRYGFESEAEIIQDLYLAGKKKEAEAAVPDEFLELTTLCGPLELRERTRSRPIAKRASRTSQVQPLPQLGQTNASLIEAVKELV